MVTFLFASVFIIGLLAVALYFWQKSAQGSEPRRLPPLPEPRSLFSDPDAERTASLSVSSEDEETQRARIIERAKGNDKNALVEARAHDDAQLYNEVLDLLVANADSDSSLLALASYVTRNELTVNNTLAQAILDSWKRAPVRSSTAKALHFAALADDAKLYQSAVETALQFWRDGRLADSTPDELQALFDGEFWILSARTRSSGAGFVLKRTLESARRELEAARAKQ